VRVVSWNSQHGVPAVVGPADLARALPHLAALGADVVAVQELDRHLARSGRADQPALLADALGGELLWTPTLRRGRGHYGHALVVRGEVVASAVAPLPGPGEPRAARVALVEVDGTRWTVAATHLATSRAAAEDQLVALVDAVAGWPAPRVLLGDWNLVPSAVLPFTAVEGYRLLTGPPTHDARRGATRRIDHVATWGARLGASGVVALPVSDHLAVWADVEPA
jgi:endonuclease/exonuclease/phosphatase family metal-dependent hydrolase